MTDSTETSAIAPPDLGWPPNPFNHGLCRFNRANGQAEDCPNPAVFEGGPCAPHAAAIAAANTRAGYDPMGKAKLPKHAKRDAGKRKAANASRRRNRK